MILENSRSSTSLKKEQAEEGWSVVGKREAFDLQVLEATDVEASEEVSEVRCIEEEGWRFKDVGDDIEMVGMMEDPNEGTKAKGIVVEGLDAMEVAGENKDEVECENLDVANLPIDEVEASVLGEDIVLKVFVDLSTVFFILALFCL